MDGLSELGLADVADMRFHRVVAVAALDIGKIDTDQPQQRVRRIAEHLQIAMLSHMAVIVDPCRADLGVDQA